MFICAWNFSKHIPRIAEPILGMSAASVMDLSSQRLIFIIIWWGAFKMGDGDKGNNIPHDDKLLLYQI